MHKNVELKSTAVHCLSSGKQKCDGQTDIRIGADQALCGGIKGLITTPRGLLFIQSDFFAIMCIHDINEMSDKIQQLVN